MLPRRLQASAGILLFVLAGVLVANGEWRFTLRRLGLFVMLTVFLGFL